MAHLPRPPVAVELPDSLLSEDDWELVERFALDAPSVLALKRLSAASDTEKNKVMAKLQRKSDIAKPSHFISVAAKNALEKITAAQRS